MKTIKSQFHYQFKYFCNDELAINTNTNDPFKHGRLKLVDGDIHFIKENLQREPVHIPYI